MIVLINYFHEILPISIIMTLHFELYNYSPFTFQVGLDDSINMLVQQVEYGDRLLNNMPAYSQIAATLEKQVMVSGIASTDTIEGGDVADAEAGQVLESIEDAANNRERRIKNLAEAYSYIDEYIQIHSDVSVLPITEKFLRSIHNAVVNELTDSEYQSGLYRDNGKGQNTYVGDNNHGGRYKPPTTHIDIIKLMKGLEQWSTSEEMVNISPLIRAPLIHYYFERIHPFNDGNGRVGRMAEKAILLHAGYHGWVKGLDRYYLDHIDDYYTAFNVCRNKEKKDPSTCNQEFIALSLQGMADTVERVHLNASNIASKMMGLAMLGEQLRTGKINSRQYEFFECLMDYADGQMTKQELNKQRWYRALYADVSATTRSRDMSGLVKLGLIEKDGNLFKARPSSLRF
mgnify:CR=1 FL=1